MTPLPLGLDPLLVVQLLLLGASAGFLAGLLGVGGGMMMVPFVTMMLVHRGVEAGLAVKMAIATSMATIVFTSVSSVRAHHARGSVRWDLVRGLAPGIVAGGLAAGAGVFAVVKGQALAVFFGLFVGFSATQMLLDRKPKPGRQMPGPAGQTAVGAGVGLLSGLVGAGGAFMTVPFMVWCNVPLPHAVGTSAALGFPIALASTLGYIWAGRHAAAPLPGTLGYLALPMLGLIAVASVSLAPLGARAAHALPRAALKRVFAALLYGLAGYMLYRGLSA